MTDGGEGVSGRVWSDAGKKRISDTLKGRPVSEEVHLALWEGCLR